MVIPKSQKKEGNFIILGALQEGFQEGMNSCSESS